MLQEELIIQNTKRLLKVTIPNLKKTWTNMALFESGLAKSYIRQLPWRKVKFKGNFLSIFDFTLPLFKALSQVGYIIYESSIFSIIFKSTLIYPVSQNALRSWWQQLFGKTWNFQCQNGARTHISRKTKSCRQHALFLWPVKLMSWISNLFLHLIDGLLTHM